MSVSTAPPCPLCCDCCWSSWVGLCVSLSVSWALTWCIISMRCVVTLWPWPCSFLRLCLVWIHVCCCRLSVCVCVCLCVFATLSCCATVLFNVWLCYHKTLKCFFPSCDNLCAVCNGEMVSNCERLDGSLWDVSSVCVCLCVHTLYPDTEFL